MKILHSVNLRLIVAFSLVLLVSLVFSLQIIHAAWSPPSDNPPNSNIAVPVNTGSAAQVKSGPLSVDGLTSYANNNHFYGAMDQRFTIRPGYRGSDPMADYTTFEMPGVDTLFIWDNLEVSNDVRADRYCDQDGNNCFGHKQGLLNNNWPDFLRCYYSGGGKSYQVLYIIAAITSAYVEYAPVTTNPYYSNSPIQYNKSNGSLYSGSTGYNNCRTNINNIISQGRAFYH